jgi:hypothetical protein
LSSKASPIIYDSVVLLSNHSAAAFKLMIFDFKSWDLAAQSIGRAIVFGALEHCLKYSTCRAFSSPTLSDHFGAQALMKTLFFNF